MNWKLVDEIAGSEHLRFPGLSIGSAVAKHKHLVHWAGIDLDRPTIRPDSGGHRTLTGTVLVFDPIGLRLVKSSIEQRGDIVRGQLLKGELHGNRVWTNRRLRSSCPDLSGSATDSRDDGARE